MDSLPLLTHLVNTRTIKAGWRDVLLALRDFSRSNKQKIRFQLAINKTFCPNPEPLSHFTSLKLCKCSQIPHPSPRIASTPNRTKTTTFGLTTYKYFTCTKLRRLTHGRPEGKLSNPWGNKTKLWTHFPSSLTWSTPEP